QSMVSFTITPLTDHTGAEVIGLDFTQPIDIETRATLSRAFAERHVLVMRNQHFTPEQFRAAAQLFGELHPHDKKERHIAGHPDVEYISNDEIMDGKQIIPGETFHTDHSNHPCPPKATTLFAVELPTSGGDTRYVNTHDAYDDLPEATKRKIDGLKAVHVYQSKYSPRSLGKISEESRRNLPPPGIPPLVRPHPENGRKALFLNPVRMHRWHGGQGSAGAHRRADAARHAEKIRISPQVASWRLGDVGQPQRHAPGQPGLRHARAPLSLSPLAQGRDAGLTAATNNTPNINAAREDDHEPCISSDSNDRGCRWRAVGDGG